MIQAGEHHAATGQRLQGRQPETLTHPSLVPVVGGVVEVNLAAVEQVLQVVHPALLYMDPQPSLPQRWHQGVEHVGAGLAALHQHVKVTDATTVVEGRIHGIGQQKQGIARRLCSPVGHGVTTHRQHRDARRQMKAVATAVGVIGNGAPPQPSQQPGHVKPPTHQPKGVLPLKAYRFLSQQVLQEGGIRLALPIGDHLCGRQCPGCGRQLQLHRQATALKPRPRPGKEHLEGA